ncbi:MAG TPA: hypothetical protein VMJ90_09160 [Anaerolineales bacterium]|nr:hypothetical protein [Anaerolineales bacterium]
MSRFAFSPRSVMLLLGIILTTSCGGAPAAAPEATATEPLIEAAEPPPEEPPVGGAQPTELVSSPPVVIAPTLQPTSPGIPVPLPPTAQPALPERRRLTLEFPPQIRAGDSDRVRLTLEVDELGNLTPTAEVGGNIVTGEVIELPNLYETHNVIAEAQFDITGLQISPEERVSQSLLPGQSVTFFWSILPSGVGIYRGTIWFYMRFVDKVSGEQLERAVSASPVEIEAVNFLGLSANSARLFGAVGSVVGTFLGFPFLEDITRFIFGRRKRLRSK